MEYKFISYLLSELYSSKDLHLKYKLKVKNEKWYVFHNI